MSNNSRDRSNRELSYSSTKRSPDAPPRIAFTYHR
jgi:predicted neuraminidase